MPPQVSQGVNRQGNDQYGIGEASTGLANVVYGATSFVKDLFGIGESETSEERIAKEQAEAQKKTVEEQTKQAGIYSDRDKYLSDNNFWTTAMQGNSLFGTTYLQMQNGKSNNNFDVWIIVVLLGILAGVAFYYKKMM